MKDEEVLLFSQVAIDNGADVETALADMRMIDTLLYADRLQKSVGCVARRTKAGYHRKGSDFYTTMDRVLEGRLNGQFDPQ